MAQPYDYLAEWFEALNDDCDYSHWSQYFISRLRGLGAGKKGLELGCGSGAFSRAFARAGYEMTGADISCAMLSKAAALAKREGLNISFVQADAASLHVPSRFDFIVSPNDCINYLSPSKLSGAFRRIVAALNGGGFFLFDVSSEYKLRTRVANNMFGDDRDDVTYIAFNTLKEDRVETDVTLFVREGELFRRFDEKHVRFIHTEGALRSALEGAGFEVLFSEGHMGEPAEGSERLNLICRRR